MRRAVICKRVPPSLSICADSKRYARGWAVSTNGPSLRPVYPHLALTMTWDKLLMVMISPSNASVETVVADFHGVQDAATSRALRSARHRRHAHPRARSTDRGNSADAGVHHGNSLVSLIGSPPHLAS